MVVVITRPGASGQRLFQRLVDDGNRTLWWPAFDIDTAPDPELARSKLARLADYDLAIFVSANAVRGARVLCDDAWPTGTMIGAVGATTRTAIESEWQPDPSLIMAAQGEDQESGSEAFWSAWQASARRVQRVLVLRAEDGRNWLIDRFSEQGAEVDAIAVYSRRVHRPSAADLQQLQRWVEQDEQPVIVFASSEAVVALDQQIDAAARAWLRTGTAIACHPRITERVESNGYARVLQSTFNDDSIIAKLKSIGNRP